MENIIFNKYLQVLVVFVVLLFVIQITKRVTKKYIVTKSIEPHRRKIILNLCYLVYYIFSGLILLLIVGINLGQMAIFASSILAVLGVGFFAQWSILSNLTACVILFFYHPIRIGDKIKILDKEFDLTGTVENITGFYVLIYINVENRRITIPNTVVLYKGIELLETNNN